MPEVDSHHATCLLVNHEVGQMSVPNTKYPVADAHQRVGAGEVGPQRQEGFRRRTHFHERSP